VLYLRSQTAARFDTVTFFDARLSRGTSGAGSRDFRESGVIWDRAGSGIGRVLRSGKRFWQRGLRSAGFWVPDDLHLLYIREISNEHCRG
jgi:hypothetical protein